MSPAELPHTQPPDEASVSPRNDDAEKWVLTKEAFDKLLDHFSPDREEAARRYEVMRVKLTRYFEWRSCASPEDEVDKAINRVARRIDQGEKILNLSAYFSSVARLIFMESLRDRERLPVALEMEPEIAAEPPGEDDQKEAGLHCLDDCLDILPIESRVLILGYYQDNGRAKIEYRRGLAERLGIPLNALRIRAHRIRKTLEQCVGVCLNSRNENGLTSL